MPTVAYLGPEHTNTHMAAQAKFGRRSRYVHAPTVDDVFELVEQKGADYGVVPIENSLEGAVTHTLDQFVGIGAAIKIHGEIEQPIRHSLIMHADAELGELKIVYSHPQVLAQCRGWLDRHLPHVQRAETNSTAEAVNWLGITTIQGSVYWGGGPTTSIEPRHRAAIARSELASKKLGQWELKAIPIPDNRENKTRFLILGLGEPKKGKRNKTSILFSLKDRPGALYDALTPFKRERINLTKIESRPSKRKAWEYYFFIDLEGHETEPRVKRALGMLKRRAEFLKVLGSYPITK